MAAVSPSPYEPRTFAGAPTQALTTRDIGDSPVPDRVRRALERGRVTLAFQPVVDARQPERVAFFEGLIRLIDDDGRTIPAADFIEACEGTEAGTTLDCLALSIGLRTLARSPDLHLAVNLSVRSIGAPRWMAVLDRGLRRDPSAARRLIIEITESSAILMPDRVARFMSTLKVRGIRFSLDDFGTGYTAFRYLRTLEFDMLKIAGEFIRGIHANSDNRCLAAALVSIGRQFGILTVAESVETASEAAVLGELGIDCLQGYHFGRPAPQPRLATAQRLAG
ncbi:EAL domain-containing protein [Tropicimonas sp. IMCC34043]|uniref:EAL domain-containing protein n=1 Tax=Tropicimonas sp. IMCC34043 TaxID=2248760 RepID=UPI000E21C582|nr:EAL domain-containing protein [Tropicimonas sp. IMCC34043]